MRDGNGTLNILIGSYTPAGQTGIHLLQYDETAERLAYVEGCANADNPSFLAVTNHANGMLYAVSETAKGAVVALRWNEDAGTFEELNRQPSGGDSPCHLTVDSTGNWLLAVNYMTGNVSLYPVLADGRIGLVAQQITHTGSSIRADRQEAPHPHSVYEIPGTDLFLVCDLGTDTVYSYRLDRQLGKLTPVRSNTVQPGAGPRHLAFHPRMDRVYVIEELSSAITVYALNRENGALSALQTISTLPAGYDGASSCAEIAVSGCGNFVYGSNRGHDSLACYRVGENGCLALIEHVPSGGRTPRNFALLPGGRYLLAANQDTHRVVLMKINEDGVPRPTDCSAEIHMPVCVKVLPSGS